MSRIPTPTTIADAPEAARDSLEGVQAQMGSVPNLFRLVANSPSALNGLLGLSGALGSGALDAATRERIALAIAEYNGCEYCLAAHSYVGAHVAKLSSEEIATNRKGGSQDPKANVAVEFAVTIAANRGRVPEAIVTAVRAAGYSDAEIVEIVTHVAYNTLTNYLNTVLGTEIDFPAAD